MQRTSKTVPIGTQDLGRKLVYIYDNSSNRVKLVSRETYDDNGGRTMSRTYHFDGLGSTMALTYSPTPARAAVSKQLRCHPGSSCCAYCRNTVTGPPGQYAVGATTSRHSL